VTVTGDRTVRAGRHELRVSIEGGTPGGRNARPPLLLINGLGGHIRMWDPLRRHLVGVPTIAFDAPGTGDSPTPALPQSVVGVSRMVTRLLDALELPEVDVLGYSLGGVVAQQLAWTSPRRVRRVVLLSTNTGWGSVPAHPVAFKGLLSMRRLRDPAYYADLAPDLLGGEMRRDPDLVAQAAQLRTLESPDTRGYHPVPPADPAADPRRQRRRRPARPPDQRAGYRAADPARQTAPGPRCGAPPLPGAAGRGQHRRRSVSRA